jgi:hypothetical protein
LNQTAAAVAILADAAASLQFEQLGVGLHKYPPCSFRVCHVCYTKFKRALEVARAELGGIEDIEVAPASRTKTNTVMLAKSFSFDNGRTTLVNTYHLSFFLVVHFSQNTLLLSLQSDLFWDVGKGLRALCPKRLLRPSTFVVGQAVTVAKRMMAGVNKEGGAARVTAVTFESDESTLYDIK